MGDPGGSLFLPPRRSPVPLLALLPLAAGGCHKLGPDLPALQTVTLTGTAVAPADQVSDLLPATPAIHLARRAGQLNVPLAYARVQALDASLRPIPGVTEARTDGGGRYTLSVPAGQPYVLRFSVGAEDRRLEMLALARARTSMGAQVVNADAASHVATKVILDKAGGIDAALQALGAPELQVVVDVIRRGLAGKPPVLTSPQAVAAVVAEEAGDAALKPMLERVEQAAADFAKNPPPMVASRVVAATDTATADVAAAPAPSPTPAASPTPAPAEAYRVVPQDQAQADVSTDRGAAPAPRNDFAPVRRSAITAVDPFQWARERAHIRIETFLPPHGHMSGAKGLDPARTLAQVRVEARRGASPESHRETAAKAGRDLRTLPPGRDPVAPGAALPSAKASPGAMAIGAGATGVPATSARPASLARTGARLKLLGPAADTVSAGAREVSHESVRPIAVDPEPKPGPLARLVDFLARWLPKFQPPTGPRTS